MEEKSDFVNQWYINNNWDGSKGPLYFSRWILRTLEDKLKLASWSRIYVLGSSWNKSTCCFNLINLVSAAAQRLFLLADPYARVTHVDRDATYIHRYTYVSIRSFMTCRRTPTPIPRRRVTSYFNQTRNQIQFNYTLLMTLFMTCRRWKRVIRLLVPY